MSPQEPCWRLGGRAWSCEESGGGCECSRGDMLPPEGFGLCEGARRTQNRILSAVVCVVQKVCDFWWSRLPVWDPSCGMRDAASRLRRLEALGCVS